MAVSASLSVAPSAPNHGDTVTATYTVSGNNPSPGQSATVSGDANVGGTDFQVSTTITLPGTPALPVTYTVPTCPGLTFTASALPNVFTAVVP
jgi:hypothetical protein